MKSLNNNRMKTLTTRHIGILPLILSASAILGSWQPLFAKTDPPSQSKPRIEVCFVLDTTGSMGGLIEGAKQKIWSIANEMISAQPTPELKLGLIGYRDRGDEYVVKSFSLTDDIDAIYGHLREFQAAGGGDAPESVNEALAEAIHRMPWSSDHTVLKIIFLVGDAPPHMDYPNSPKYPDLCREAAKKDLIINTIQCGEMAETKPIWQEIAKLSEGSYVGISQSGNVAVISTPMDKELSRLNERIGATPHSVWRQQTAGRSSCEICSGEECSRCRNGRSAHLQQQDGQGCAGPR
jgi:Mg-chelatase subunit ChlD